MRLKHRQILIGEYAAGPRKGFDCGNVFVSRYLELPRIESMRGAFGLGRPVSRARIQEGRLRLALFIRLHSCFEWLRGSFEDNEDGLPDSPHCGEAAPGLE